MGVATVAVIALVPLAVTSNRWSMKRLGRRWKQLHLLVYPALALAGMHLYFLPEREGEFIRYAVLVVPGLVLRIPAVRRAVVEARRRAAVERA